jgi:uncharacterized protein
MPKMTIARSWMQKKLQVILLCFFCQVAVADLPKQVQADLLQDDIIAALKNNAMQEAKSAIRKYRALGIDLPPTIMIIEAKVAIAMKEYLVAKKVLEQFFKETGTKHKSYKNALELYKLVREPAAKIEKEQKRQAAINKKKSELQAIVKNLENQCNRGYGDKCTNLGYKYDIGKDVAVNEQLAFKYYKKACDLKSSAGCNNLGSFYQSGRGTTVDLKRAAELYKWACDKHNIKYGCSNLANLYKYGLGVKKNPARARKLYAKSCNAGKKVDCKQLELIPKTDEEKFDENYKLCNQNKSEACALVGLAYSTGKGAPHNGYEAEDYFKKSCKLSSGLGCYHAGKKAKHFVTDRYRYYKKSCRLGNSLGCKALEEVKVQLDKDNTPLEKSCNQGRGSDCTTLGERYDSGYVAVLDDVKAVSLFKKACELNDAKGCNFLGVMTENGEGTTANPKQAVKLYKKSCNGGYVQKGCNNLGISYEQGKGIKKSYSKARKYYKLSCEAGYGYGCNSLGLLHKKGKGGRTSSKKAFQYFEKACASYKGKKYGCYNLGLAYLHGRGVSKDEEKAQEYFQDSCYDDHSASCKELKKLRGY